MSALVTERIWQKRFHLSKVELTLPPLTRLQAELLAALLMILVPIPKALYRFLWLVSFVLREFNAFCRYSGILSLALSGVCLTLMKSGFR